MDVLIEISGETCELAEAAARQWASSRTNAFFISPYADIDVIAGQVRHRPHSSCRCSDSHDDSLIVIMGASLPLVDCCCHN